MIQTFTSAHVPTMLLMSVILSGVMALAVLSVAQRLDRSDGLFWWGGALLLNTVSDALFVIAAEDPWTGWFIGGYWTLSAAAAAALQAVLVFFSWRLNSAWLWLPLTALCLLAVPFAADPVASVRVLEPILVLQFGLVAWAAWRGQHPGRPRRTERSAVILSIGMALAALSYVQRVVQVVLGLPVPMDLVTPDAWQTLIFVQGITAMVFATLGLVLMHKEHADAEARRANDALVEIERERARLDERQRLLQDVHDGFGSQLATARLRVLDHDLDPQQVGDLLRECLDDLYLVIDTLNNPDNILDSALVDYRHRLNTRLARLPVEIDWQLDLDACPPLDERVILQVMRILQEALANALKHAQARHLVVAARCRGDEPALRIVIADDGIGMPAEAVRGRGLDNMRNRARVIGADLQWKPNHPGTQVVLELPSSGR